MGKSDDRIDQLVNCVIAMIHGATVGELCDLWIYATIARKEQPNAREIWQAIMNYTDSQMHVIVGDATEAALALLKGTSEAK